MENDKENGLSGLQKDALKEISNITTGNATTALSKLVGKEVKVTIPSAELFNKEELCNSLGGPKNVVISIYCNINGDITGQALFLFKRDAASRLVELVSGKKPEKKHFDPYSESAFGEMANIFTGSYLNALAELFSMTIMPGIPLVATDYVGPIIDYVWGRIKNPQEKMLCFTTTITVDEEDVNGDFVFMFDSDSYKTVLEKLEKKYGVNNLEHKNRK